MTPTLAQARRHVRNLAAIRRRIEQRQLGGRNGRATEDAIAYHLRMLREFWIAGEYDESDPAIDRLWARYNALERWSVGLPS